MRFRIVVVGFAGMVAAFGSSQGQAGAAKGNASVRGVAFDSLRSAPLEGAFVRMTGNGVARSTTTNAYGEFGFDSVPPGTYAFSMMHAALDSLGFSGISSRAAVNGRFSAVFLSIPSFATLWRDACGAGSVPHDTGFVFGTVRDAERGTPLAGATVTVRWIALGVDSSTGKDGGGQPSVTEQAWGGEVRSDSTGGYALCGVPFDATLRMLARKDSSSSGLLELVPHDVKRPPVERRDFLLGPSADSSNGRRGVVAGLVHDATGNAVVGARVVTTGADETRTGADGRFVIANVPVGTREIDVLSIGAEPVNAAADVTTRDTAFVSVELRKIVELSPVVVTSKAARQRMLAELEERRALGFGHFIDSTRIAPFRTLQNAIELEPEVICPLYIDGVRYVTTKDIANELHQRDSGTIAMIEWHDPKDPNLPYIFRPTGSEQCSGVPRPGDRLRRSLPRVVLVWTKGWLP